MALTYGKNGNVSLKKLMHLSGFILSFALKYIWTVSCFHREELKDVRSNTSSLLFPPLSVHFDPSIVLEMLDMVFLGPVIHSLKSFQRMEV